MIENYDDDELIGSDKSPILSRKLSPHIELKLCDVAIDDFNLHQREFRQEDQKFVLLVKNRNEQFYHEYRDEELHIIIKSLFFRDENLIIDDVFWRKHQQIFEIDVKFDSIEL